MQLSVIILNYNVRFFLEQCVLSVQKALEGIDGEIIVVDNNSADDSCAMMKQLFPQVKLIENKVNLGFPKGNNLGVAEAKGEYICILNPDTVVAEDTFSEILKFHTQNHGIGITGCKLIDGTGKFLPECKRGVPTPWVALTKIFGLYKIFPKSILFNRYYAQHLGKNETGKVDILVGAFMVMKKDLYLEIGGFDEACFMYSDDIDLSYSVLKSGKPNYYFNKTTVIHYKGESTVRDGTYMKRFREAMQFFYKKHFGGSSVFDVLMRIGTFVFSFFKKSQQKNTFFPVDEYVFFTKSLEKLSLGFPVTYLSQFHDFVSNPSINYKLIFDIHSFTNKEIIDFMEDKSAKNLTFSNYVSSSGYIVGSNHANDIGEVIKLTKIE